LTTGLLASGKVPAQWSEEETRELQALYNELAIQDDDMSNSLERARHTNEKAGQFIEYHEGTIKPELTDLQKRFERMIFARANDLSVAEIFKQATNIIALYDNLYDKTSDAFLELLKQRRDEYTLKRDLVFYTSTAAFLGFIVLFVFLYRTLAKTERAEQAAGIANEAKSEFLANMSHELRTPLNSILGMNRLLLESGLTEEQQGLADTVFRSSVNLLEIVNDILDLSKIEAGELRLEHIGFDPQYVFHGVVHALDHIAREKRVPIIRHYEKETFPYLLGDPTRLGRVLVNLIGNAIKYTDKGEVDIRASCKKLDDKHIEFRCEITDTGIGIPEEKQATIFEKFVQADTSTTRKYGGTGLGLAITKQLVELMGGKIGVQSVVGTGSTFWFEISFEVTNKLHEEKHIRQQKALLGTIPPEKARILAAEDHPMNQLLIRKLLQKFGIGHFKIVENGLDVLKCYKENAWDAILMDCHMPEKNGYDATRDIRDAEKTTKAHIPIIAMTANAMVGDKEKCLRYGMDEYISKPINIEELKEILGQWIRFDSDALLDPKSGIEKENSNPVDLTQLRTFTHGDLETEKELIGAFVKQSDENLRLLKENCTGGECKTWVEAAHMFKGGASGVGAAALSQLCSQAQQTLDATADERVALFKLIESEYAKTKTHLKGLGLLS
jgi:signal transduction histidine kinase/CheY-like chemotaxis protein/HPt (histidine-containing phosphotransfer) domain-containing protein